MIFIKLIMQWSNIAQSFAEHRGALLAYAKIELSFRTQGSAFDSASHPSTVVLLGSSRESSGHLHPFGVRQTDQREPPRSWSVQRGRYVVVFGCGGSRRYWLDDGRFGRRRRTFTGSRQDHSQRSRHHRSVLHKFGLILAVLFHLRRLI